MKNRPSLTQIHRHAVTSLGPSAPSLVTIKRLSASKEFENLDATQIQAYLKARFGGRMDQPSTVPAENTKTSDHRASDTDLIARIDRMEAELKRQSEQSAAMLSAAAQLIAVRNTLMSKYDAVSAQQLQTIASLQERNKALVNDSGISMELSRIKGILQRLTDNIEHLVSK